MRTGTELEHQGRAQADAATPKRRGCFRLSCLLQAGLGCFSFVLGNVIVLIVLLPMTVAAVFVPAFETSFNEHHRGMLDIGDLRLSWTEWQRAKGVTLRDPDGAYVASIDLSTPSLVDLIESSDSGRLASTRLNLDANLNVDDEGVLNLARAFERDPLAEPAPNESGDWAEFNFDGLDVEMLVGEWRIAWSSPTLRASGSPQVVVVLTEGLLDMPDQSLMRLNARGRLQAGNATRDGEPSLELELAFTDLERFLAGRERAQSWTWNVEGLPADLLGALGPGENAGIPYTAAFGERIGFVRLARSAELGAIYELEVRGDQVRLDAAGAVRDGMLRSVLEDGPAVDGTAAPRTARVDFALNDFWRDTVVLGLLPFLGGVAPGEEDQLARIELTSFELPLDGDLARATGDLRVDLGAAAFVVFPRPAGVEGDERGGVVCSTARRIPPARLSLNEGRVEIESLVLDVDKGRLSVTGGVELATGAVDLELRTSVELASQLLAEPLEVEEGQFFVRVGGDAEQGFRFALERE